MSLRDLVLSADDLKREEVPIPEWGTSVYVRTMSGSERDQFEAAYLKSPQKDVRARIAIATVCDEQGQAVFTEDDLEAVGRKSAAALDRILAVGMRLNGLGKKDIEELEGNS